MWNCQMKVFLMIVRSRENEEIIICLGKGFCSFGVPAFIFSSGSLCWQDWFFFFLPYSCRAKSCIFLAKCSLLAWGTQEILCQRIKQAEVCQNKYSSLKISSCGGGVDVEEARHVLRLSIYFMRIRCSWKTVACRNAGGGRSVVR